MSSLCRMLNLLVLLVISLNLLAQQNSVLESVDEECVKLNTDRDLYFCGEDILFTADYFINNTRTYPVLSNKLFVELIESTSNTPVVQKKYKISDFKVNGEINIPVNSISGSYLLRVYTSHQKNLSVYSYTSSYITIINPKNSLPQESIADDKDSVYIAIEGNVLLDSIESNVIIKLPKSLIVEHNEYLIIDERDSILKQLKYNQSGFLKTEMFFEKSKKYKLLIKTNDRDSIINEFPKVKSVGMQTSVKLVSDSIIYKIQMRGLNSWDKNQDFQLLLYDREFRLQHKESLLLEKGSILKRFPLDLLDNGINYIVLEDGQGSIKKINSVYKKQQKFNALDIELNKDHFKPREDIKVHIKPGNEKLYSLPVLSVSVTRVGARKEDHEFIPDLFLNNPLAFEDYLNSGIRLDEVIQNWMMILFDRTIDVRWFENSYNGEMQIVPKSRDNYISGILRNKNTKEPISNCSIYLVVLFNSSQLHVTNTNENGEFMFSVNNMYGENDIYICYEPFEDNVEGDYEILVRNSFSSDYLPKNKKTFLDNNDKALIKELYVNAQIQQVFRANQNNNIEKELKLPFNVKGFDVKIIPDNFIELETMQELFNEIVPSVNVTRNKIKDKYTFKIVGEDNYLLTGKPLVLLDHIPIFNNKSIMNLDPSQIEKIEVIYKTYIIGAYPFNGVIMLTSKTDNFADIKLPNSSVFAKYQALEAPSNNLEIDYNYSDTLHKVPDFRTTLYWNPQIKLQPDGNVLNFKVSDRRGEYKIIIKGYDFGAFTYYAEKYITIE